MILLFISLFILIYSFAVGRKDKFNNIVYWGLFICLVFLKVYVDISVLPDLEHYYWGYIELACVDWSKIPTFDLTFLKCPEIGFRYILRIGALLGDFKWSLFIIAVVHTYTYINLAKKYSPYVMISLIIFLLGSVQSFFVLRQHLAIAITILSYPYIINRDWKKFFLLMLLAFSFHQTAVVFIPVYFIYGIKDHMKLNITLAIILAVLFLTFTMVFNYFAVSFVGYEGYIDSNEGNMTTLIISACYLFAYVFFLRGDIYIEGVNRLVYILLVLNFIVLLAGYTFSGINRLMMYYSVGNILAVPLSMKFIRYPLMRYAFCSTILFLLVYIFCTGSNAVYLNGI